MTKTRYWVVAVVVAVAFIGVLSGCGREAAVAAARAPNPVTLTIDQSPLSATAGEDVPLTTVLANTTNRRIAVRRFPGLTTMTTLRLEADRYLRETESRKMVGDIRSISNDLLTLGPHESIKLRTRVSVSPLATRATTLEVTCTFESTPVAEGPPDVWTGKLTATTTVAVTPKE